LYLVLDGYNIEMQHPDELTIERVILGDATLPPGEREATEAHVQSCPSCDTLAGWLRRFYAEAAQARTLFFPELAALVDHIAGAPSREHLIRYRPQEQAGPRPQAGITVLAAMSPLAEPTTRFQTVATLACRASGTVARIQLDRQQDSYRFYLHTEDPDRLRGVVVTCPELSADLVLDENGQTEFSLARTPDAHEWSQLEAVARWPLARLGLMEGMQGEGIVSLQADSAQGRLRVSLTRTDRDLGIEAHVDADEVQPEVAVIQGSAGKSVLVRLSEGKGVMSGEIPPGPLEIRLYS
jgi:hypothetical protein